MISPDAVANAAKDFEDAVGNPVHQEWIAEQSRLARDIDPDGTKLIESARPAVQALFRHVAQQIRERSNCE